VGELGDLFELMHGARGRWRTVRLTVRDWSHTARSTVAFDRWRASFEARGGTTSRFTAYAPGRAEPPPETSEHITRIWIDGERSRVENDRGSGATVVVHDGVTWWMTWPDHPPMTNAGDSSIRGSKGDQVEPMLDPAGLIGDYDFELRGAREFAGRPGLVARAVARQRDPHRHLLWQLRGTDELELVVDGERGILLGFTAFVDDEPCHVREIVEIAFDETFPEETFRIELPPGESFARAGGRAPTHLTLDQAVQTASFALFVPARPGPGWELAHVTYFEESERTVMAESVFLSYSHETGTRQFQLVETTEPHPWLVSDELKTVERDGYVMKTLDPSEADFPMPRHVLVERDGTHVNLNSQDLSLDELIELAATLVPVTDSPPPAVER
jgi:hypothetical protein